MVRGSQANAFAVWRSALGAYGYGRFWFYPGGVRIMMQPNRYALAAAADGAPLEQSVIALHGCK
ncbi:hypothetical protein MCNS_12530 [Mycobacterium conspicuum]|jgi:hypothetical protein|uniref:Uncharacterized protein n=1 Tax=Mycobacterium conspicuum TaxID=44010 RepID=A0A1X1TH34_9MYCO|nr:hypothetical protein AWC00_09375 [Mycobacterium conspicuum]BBZ38190.1 hypothetical protein MCNS_12530 [Mycobacterium conspicuum]BBZ48936.1 hypothetical protein MHEI_06530 [Mycobacterium heidelbergense]